MTFSRLCNQLVIKPELHINVPEVIFPSTDFKMTLPALYNDPTLLPVHFSIHPFLAHRSSAPVNLSHS
jgi:hypothetical protein